MVDVVYYVAASLDGYIATPDGGVAWLPPIEASGEDYGYYEFYNTIDALLMGRRTYEHILEYPDWPYPGKPCWVFTRRQRTIGQPKVMQTPRSPLEIVAELQARHLMRAWLVGGGDLASAFRAHGLISEYAIGIVPTILGAGIPLFATAGPLEQLHLTECQTFANGVVMLRYLHRRDI